MTPYQTYPEQQSAATTAQDTDQASESSGEEKKEPADEIARLRCKIESYENGAVLYQRHRWEDWRENYQLYRDKVIYNRITQRQSVNVPLMKETIRTILASTDDAPDIRFSVEVPQAMGNYDKFQSMIDKAREREMFMNEKWKATYKRCNLEIRDVVDKKQVMLYGRSFKKFNIINGNDTIEIADPADILVDRYGDPTDIDSFNYIAHTRIYRTLGQLSTNESYDQDVVAKLKSQYANAQGLIKAAENMRNMAQKAQKLQDMGDFDAIYPQLGETYVEIKEHYVKIYDEDEIKEYETEDDGFVIYRVVTCDGEILCAKALIDDDSLRVNFFPFESWADDVEGTSFWSDAVADIVRTPNKIANSFISQLVENRTLRNFGMNYYDASEDGFLPQTFTPEPWGWYPIPGNPNEKIRRVDIPELSESIDELQLVIDMVQRATAATATIKGETAGSRTTLGEIEIVAKSAMERITSIAKFYRHNWAKSADKWARIVNANLDRLNDIKVYRRAESGAMYGMTLKPERYKSDSPYIVTVSSSSEQESFTIDTIKKYQAVGNEMAGNPVLELVKRRKMLSLLDVSPEEERDIMEFERKRMSSMQQVPQAIPAPQDMGGQGQMQQQMPAGAPAM